MNTEGKPNIKAGGEGIRWLRRAVAAAMVLAILGLSSACGERNTYVPPPPPKVTVSQPVQQPVTDYLEFTGNTKAINTVQLRARVEGYLEKVLFQDGDRVKKGQLLFLIQQNTYEAKLKQAEAEILANKARLDPRPNRICPVLQAGEGEGRGPDGRGPLAVRTGCGRGRGHGRGGQTRPGQAQPGLYQGHRPL